MARHLANLTNGQIDEKGFLRLFGVLLNQSGVLQSSSLAVAQQSTPDMSVKVAGAVTGHDIVFITSDGAVYHGWNTADETVLISSNASGVTKTDAIVAYADLTSGIATSNNPGALKFSSVRRSGSNTGAPTSGEISTAVSSNPYVVLAHVTVSNGAGSINSGNIADQRARAQIEADRLENLVIPKVTVDNTAATFNPATGAITAVSGWSVTVDVPAGSPNLRIDIDFFVKSNLADRGASVYLYKDGSALKQFLSAMWSGDTSRYGGRLSHIDTGVTAGSHTYAVYLGAEGNVNPNIGLLYRSIGVQIAN